MTKRIVSRYKILRQHYIDVWENGKRGVKPLKKVYILNILLHLVEKKKKYLRFFRNYRPVFNTKQKKYFFKNREKTLGFEPVLYRDTNLIVLPYVEQVLKQIPKEFMDLNKKTRVYKYLRRNNKKLFQSIDRIIAELVLILERKRRKPFWRRTVYEHFLRKYQLLRSFYGNLNFQWFRSLCRKEKFYLSIGDDRQKAKYKSIDFYKLLECRLDIVLFRSGLVNSVSEARQVINHGKIYINSVVCKQPAFLLKEGDVISWNRQFIEQQLAYRRNQFFFYFFELSSLLKKSSAHSSFMNSHMIKEVLVHLKSQLTHLSLLSMKANKINAISQMNVSWNGIEDATRYTKFKFLSRELPDHLLFSEKTSVLIFLKKPEFFLYPFSMSVQDFQKMINYLNR